MATDGNARSKLRKCPALHSAATVSAWGMHKYRLHTHSLGVSSVAVHHVDEMGHWSVTLTVFARQVRGCRDSRLWTRTDEGLGHRREEGRVGQEGVEQGQVEAPAAAWAECNAAMMSGCGARQTVLLTRCRTRAGRARLSGSACWPVHTRSLGKRERAKRVVR